MFFLLLLICDCHSPKKKKIVFKTRPCPSATYLFVFYLNAKDKKQTNKKTICIFTSNRLASNFE